MTCPRYDLHIHTKYLGCANETMEVPDIIEECHRLGVTTVGITDHLNTLDQLPADATHIKLIEGERMADLLPLVDLIGRIRVRVLSVHHH